MLQYNSFSQVSILLFLVFMCSWYTAVSRLVITGIMGFLAGESVTHAPWPISSLLQPARTGRFIIDVTASSDYFTASSLLICAK